MPGLHARDTRRVYEELLGSARAFDLGRARTPSSTGPKAFEVLARRMDETPSLQVTLLLNIQRKRGDTTRADAARAAGSRIASGRTDWPGDAQPERLLRPAVARARWPDGVLHAKAVVADDETVFVTSANLTEAAFDRNIELGLLVRDRALAASVSSTSES